MADDSDDENQATRKVSNQPYDESLEVPDAEEVASNYSSSPRVPSGFPAGVGHGGGDAGGMSDSEDEFEAGTMENKGEDDDNSQQPDGQESEEISQLISPIQPIAAAHQRPAPLSRPPQSDDDDEDDEDEDDDEEESSEEEDDDDDDDDDDAHGVTLEGAYDPTEYENLPVNAEIKELFQYITRYTPQAIDLEHKLKPFIPDYIPAVGDIDAFIKITRPDGLDDQLGLNVLDEPCAKQSDPTVLDLQLRALSKQTTSKAIQVRSIEDASKNPKMINNWIESISDLHRSKPPPTVHYNKTMPDIETLMQEWPGEFEDLLNKVGLPTADIDSTLEQYVEMICSILDIPIYQSKIQSLHVLFTLFSEFKNSQHFKSLAEDNKLDNRLKKGGGGGIDDDTSASYGDEDADRLVF